MTDRGRPTSYREEYNEQARKLCLLGHTDSELAGFFDVTEQTINNWKKDYPDFFESIKKGREVADAEVAASLYERACGYSHVDTKFATYEGQITDSQEYVKHYPPDTKAAEIWLHNRQRGKWKKDPENDGNKGFKLPFGKSSVK